MANNFGMDIRPQKEVDLGYKTDTKRIQNSARLATIMREPEWDFAVRTSRHTI